MSNLSKTFKYVNAEGRSIIFEWSSGYIINAPVGIDTVTVSLTQAQGIDQVGATVQSVNVQPRAINISGYVVGDGQDAAKSELLAVIRPDLSGKLYADDYYIEVYPTATPAIGYQKQLAQFSFTLLAAYPYWQKDENTSVEMSKVDYGFRLKDDSDNFCFRFYDGSDLVPFYFGQVQNSQFFDIRNGGQVPVPFTIVFKAKGAVTNPKITCVNNNQILLINKSLIAGETVTVKITHERTSVTSTVDGDCRGALSLSSNFIRLPVGNVRLKPEADSGGSNLDITLSYATEIVGISL